MYFNINNNVNLSIKQFILLLTIVFILFALYYRLFISNHCFPAEKYKSLVKKYKLMTEKYQNKLAEYDELIDTQNSIIQEYTSMTNNGGQVGSHTSAHSGALTPSKFISSKTGVTVNPNVILNATSNKQTNNITDSYLMSSIDNLIKQDDNLAIADPNLNGIHMQINGPSSFDTFWQM